MDQRLSIITIGAKNLAAMRNFYIDKFGWKPVAENKDIIFFKLNGLLFSLWGRKEMAEFHQTTLEEKDFRPYNMAYLVNSKEEVLQLYRELKEKGVTISQEPTDTPFGGHFFLAKDVEGNIWDIAWNSYIELNKAGDVITHHPIDKL